MILLFKVKDFYFGIESNFITEIIRMVKLTKIPSDVGKVNALVNYRGATIPVMDIANYIEKFRGEYDIDSIIIVVKDGNRTIGLLTDDVVDVVDSESYQFQSYSGMDNDFFKSALQVESKIYPILNLKRVLQETNLAENLIKSGSY